MFFFITEEVCTNLSGKLLCRTPIKAGNTGNLHATISLKGQYHENRSGTIAAQKNMWSAAVSVYSDILMIFSNFGTVNCLFPYKWAQKGTVASSLQLRKKGYTRIKNTNK